MSKVFDTTSEALAQSLNFRLMRHNLTSANIANAETPGYNAKKVDFEEALSRAIDLEKLGSTHSPDPEHIALGTGSIGRSRVDVYDNPDANVTNDKNTVDLEKEMSTLAENSILYKAAVELINKKIAQTRYAITEGGK
jgi:flagellar basal-body rod protein FlgB